MKVLLLSLFHPELVRGGAQQVCYELFNALKEMPGVEPTLLAAVDPSFDFLYKSGARITGFDGRDNEFLFLSRGYDYIWHKTHSALLTESFIEFLQLVQPDVVHFHHLLLFGVDLISVVKRTLPNAKIVFTLHEFISICAADGQLVRTTDKSICNQATPVRCHQCFPDYGPDHFFLREQWIKRHLDLVDVFTTPSRFMMEVYSSWGIAPERLQHVSNGQRNQCSSPIDRTAGLKRNRFGFFGQFLDNKGVHILLEAVTHLRSQGFEDFSVELNGANIKYASPTIRRQIEEFLEAESLLPLDQRLVFNNGSYQVDQLSQRMSRIDWCVVPSVWLEAFGLVLSEAWMFGRPVIASNIGAMAERVSHGRDGLLFNVSDSRALAAAMHEAALDPDLWQNLSSQITMPNSSDTMAWQFVDLYRALQSMIHFNQRRLER